MRDEPAECSDMSASLAISGNAAPTGVTTFSNEACEGVKVLGSYVGSSIAKPQPDLQSLSDYFARPRLLVRGTISFGSRAQVTSWTVSRNALLTVFPQMAQRLAGVYGVRFTLVFRVQIAVTAFHQGLISCNFQYAPVFSNTTSFVRGNAPQTCTNIPHVRLDPSETTMVELHVPFLYPLEFMQVANDDEYSGTYGLFCIHTILPFISVASLSSPTYECYVSLEDLEYFGADNASSTTITLQAGAFSMAEELRKTRLISTSLDVSSKITDFVARNVPMLSAVAGPTSWFLDKAAGVARYFGFSKPLVQDPPLRILRMPYSSDGHVDVPFAGFAVGPFQSNTLAIQPEVAGCDIDEMSLAFVFAQWSQICVGQISTSNSHSSFVYATPVSPCCFWFRAIASAPFCNIPHPNTLNTVNGHCIQFSTLSYVASFFRMWRGSIEFRVTFAKTKFHGGRYMISYNPRTVARFNNGVAVTSIEGPEVAIGLVQPYGYSKIVDLKDGNVFEFSVPYLNEKPYRTFYDSIGGLSITCIDPLQSSGSTTATVPFLVEVRGGPDFEVADYVGSPFVPYDNPTFYVQSGRFSNADDSGPSRLSPIVETATSDPSQLTMGESFSSLKQVIQIPTYCTSSLAGNATATVAVPQWHYYNSNAQITPVAPPLPAATTWTGTSHNPPKIAAMYSFARGSTDAHVYPQTNNVVVTVDQTPQPSQAVSDVATSYAFNGNFGGTPKVVSVGDAPIHVRFPAYQSLARPVVGESGAFNFTRLLGSVPTGIPAVSISHYNRIKVTNGVATAISVVKGFSAGDDAMMTGFRGPPPVVVPNTLSTNNISPDYA